MEYFGRTDKMLFADVTVNTSWVIAETGVHGRNTSDKDSGP
jgi:hypothetical protein